MQVLPTLICYCDQDWYASVLKKCRVDGSDLELPFECPLDIALNPGDLDLSPLPYRMTSFLSDPRIPAHLRHSREEVIMDTDTRWIELQHRNSADVRGFVVAGAEAEDLRDSLRGSDSVHVLQFRGLRPGAFGGFGTLAEDAAFDKAFAAALGKEAKWCCRCVLYIAEIDERLQYCFVHHHSRAFCYLWFPFYNRGGSP
jgi:arabinosyltransferase